MDIFECLTHSQPSKPFVGVISLIKNVAKGVNIGLTENTIDVSNM